MKKLYKVGKKDNEDRRYPYKYDIRVAHRCLHGHV